jgi:hypothetical protein
MATTGGSRRRPRSAKAAVGKATSQAEGAAGATEATEAAVEKATATEATETTETETETAINAVEVEEIMAEQTKATSNGDASKPGKLELAPKPDTETNGHPETEPNAESRLVVHTQGSEEIEIAETFTSAGLRPIGASHMEIFGTILNNRPIMASHLQVLDYSLPGNRPIFASDIIVRDDLTLPGGRPIMASDPNLLEAGMIMGGRPIASNEIDDSETLMGFID